MSLKQPVSQVRLTNVAVVRLKVKGKRFEVAAYKNTVLSWREGNQKDLDEVLQITSVFTNVSKGVLANSKDLQAAFGTTDVPLICERILRTGVLQVSDREREYTSGRLFSSIASIVADKCVDAETRRPIPVGVIERSMKDLLGYSVVPGRSAKAQALEVIKGLAAHMPIERAQMRLDVEAPVKYGKGVKGALDGLVVGLVGAEEWGGGFRASYLVEPKNFNAVQEVVAKESRGSGSVTVSSVAVVHDDEDGEL